MRAERATGRRRLGLGALVAASLATASGCGEDADGRTSLLLSIANDPSALQPLEIRLSVYDRFGAEYAGQRLPVAGELTPVSDSLLGTVRIYPTGAETSLRVEAHGLRGETWISQGTRVTQLLPRRETTAVLTLEGGRLLLDSDADGVPDDIDNCPATANSDQRNADGMAEGDACAPADVSTGAAF